MYCLSCSIFREIVPRSYSQTRPRSSPYCKNSTSSIFVPRGRYVYFVIEIPVPHILCRHHTAPAPPKKIALIFTKFEFKILHKRKWIFLRNEARSKCKWGFSDLWEWRDQEQCHWAWSSVKPIATAAGRLFTTKSLSERRHYQEVSSQGYSNG